MWLCCWKNCLYYSPCVCLEDLPSAHLFAFLSFINTVFKIAYLLTLLSSHHPPSRHTSFDIFRIRAQHECSLQGFHFSVKLSYPPLNAGIAATPIDRLIQQHLFRRRGRSLLLMFAVPKTLTVVWFNPAILKCAFPLLTPPSPAASLVSLNLCLFWKHQVPSFCLCNCSTIVSV